MKTRLEGLFPGGNDIPEEFLLRQAVNQSEYLIDGEILHWKGDMENVYSPVYVYHGGKPDNFIGAYPLMDEKTSLEALRAATAAYHNGRGVWPMMSVEQRIACIRKFVVLMREKRDEVVKLLMWEIGKNLKDSEKEFDRTIEYILDTIDALKDLDRDSSRFVIRQGIIAQIRRAPLGVVLCMGPYNYPLNETLTTLIPALIMGNTVIFKPPKLGVLLHRPLLEAYRDAFPKGVVNTVYGEGQQVIAPLMASGGINVLAFIGSSRVADILKKQHPEPHKLRSVLGLEAKNPAIILSDADMDTTVRERVLGSLSYNGQRCTAIKIIFVHESIRKTFMDRFTDEIEKIGFGMPWDEDAFITPLPEPGKSEYLRSLADDAVQKGASIANPSGGMSNRSFFFPRVLGDVGPDLRHSGAARLYHSVELRAAGQHLRRGCRNGGHTCRHAGQPGVQGEHQLAVPARPRYFSLYREEGFGRGNAIRKRCPAGILHSHDGGAQGKR